MRPELRAIVTAPPHADFLADVAAHPIVDGLRLNTVMPVKGPLGDTLDRLAALAPLWVDLKGRQLRVVEPAVPPYTAIRVSHPVDVPVPCDIFFDDGRTAARVLAVDGDRLLLDDGPHRVVGPGESVNIVHPQLRIDGTLTDGDRAWLAAMAERGHRRVMLSYVESAADVDEVRALLPDADVICKIETPRGLDLVARRPPGRLMAARGDLYVEVRRPHRVIGAVRRIIAADPTAIVASRVLDSLAYGAVPECADLGDVAFLASIGYRTFLLGDRVCLRKDTVLAALDVLAAVGAEL